MSFDKEGFANLLKKAKGNRSINKYAQEIDISPAHISRLIRGLIDTPPSPETINKFAQRTYEGVTYNDFMIAAGHLVKENETPEKGKNSMQEKEFLQILLSELYQQDYEWRFENIKGAHFTPDFTIRLTNSEYSIWYIELKIINSIDAHQLYRLYGVIATLELTNDIKFTIAVQSLDLYDYIKGLPPLSLRVNLFIMYVDLQKREIIKEERLCSY